MGIAIERVGYDDARFETCFDIRVRVFVEEQGVPMHLERDDHEAAAVHLLARLDGEPVGTARLRAFEGTAGKVERVAVLPAHRGSGIGVRLMAAVEDIAREDGFDRLVLSAQTDAVGFYERLGYAVTDDEPFVDAGIPHRRMAKAL